MKIFKTGISGRPGKLLTLLSGTVLLFSAPFAGAETPPFEDLYGGVSKAAVTDGNNTKDIIVNASGETSGAHPNVSFHVFGIDAGTYATNTGDITLTAVGGGTTAPPGTADAEIYAYGIDSEQGVDNSGDISVKVTGGTGTASETSYYNSVCIFANGISTGYLSDTTNEGDASAGKVTNSGKLTVSVTGGIATATNAKAYANVTANGIIIAEDCKAVSSSGSASAGTVANSGDILLTIIGGTAGSDSTANAVTGADAIFIGGATATASSIAGDSTAGTVINSGKLTVSVTGGKATATNAATNAGANAYAYADTDADGIYIKDVKAYPSGGKASAGNVTNSGDIFVSIIGGTATASSKSATASAYARAHAYGIYAEGTGDAHSDQADTLGSITNSGAITVTAVGGIASADSDASATANGHVMAFGLAASGQAEDADLEPEGDGADSFGDVINSGKIVVDARAGVTKATSSSYAYANSASEACGIGNGSMGIGPVSDDEYYSDIYGADSFGTVNNSASITATATAAKSTATVNREDTATGGFLYANATAGAIATGIEAWGSMYGATIAVIDAEADGVDYIGTVKNSGTVTVSAVGEIATASITSADQDPNRTAAADADAYAVGIMTYGNGYDTGQGINYFGAVENSGAVTVTAAAGDADARISSSSTTADPDPNYAYADANANADAYGILAESYGFMAGSLGEIGALTAIETGEYGDVTNSGTITVKATAGDASAGIESASPVTGGHAYADAEANAYAISAPGDINNSGKLSATATAGKADVSSDCVIAFADAYAESAGITTTSSSAKTGLGKVLESTSAIMNTGAISVSATGGTAGAKSSEDAHAGADAEAYGIQAEISVQSESPSPYDSYGSVTNSGNITVSARGGTAGAESSGSAYAYANADAYGIQAGGGIQYDSLPLDEGGDSYGSVTNSGNITVSAMGGTAGAESSGAAYAYADASAFGIYASSSKVVNSGDIVVTAVGGSATSTMSEATNKDVEPDARAVGIQVETGELINSGDITVTAEAKEGSTSSAVGIHFDGDGVLTNTGVIRASGDRAYETVVENGTVTLADYYNLTLDGSPAIGSIAVGEDAVLNLNNAKLGLTAIGGETLWNTEYAIFDTTDGGTVDGAFSGLASFANPNITARYLDHGTGGSADDTVVLNYTPQDSTLLEGAHITRQAHRITTDIAGTRQINGFLNDRLTAKLAVFSNLYADAGTWATDAVYRKAPAGGDNGFYVTPFFSDIRKDNGTEYDAQTWGMVLGYDHSTDGTMLGAHVGLGTTDLDYDGLYNGNSEDQDYVTAGIHAMGAITGNWTWRSQVSGYYGDNDYKGMTGLNLDQVETGDYNSYGALASLMAGYAYQICDSVLLPEVGFDYQYLKTDSLHTRSSNSNFDLRADGLDEHQVTSVASLQWLARQKAGDLLLTPGIKVAVRHLLTDDNLSTSQSIGGSVPVAVQGDTVDRTTGVFTGTLSIGKENLSTEVGYQGELGEDTTIHSAWLQVKYHF